MPSNNRNRGFAVPGEFGRRLAYASDVGVLVRPTPEALEQASALHGDSPRFQNALKFVEDLPPEGRRVRCGQFALSERTHSIIERNRNFRSHCDMIAPAIVAPEGYKLAEINVGWVEIDLLIRYSGSKELAQSREPGVNTWSFIAEKSGAPRDSVKRAFFTALYGINSDDSAAEAWQMISARFPELGILRRDMRAFGPGYMQRRANDWRSDIYGDVIGAVPFPIVLVGPSSSGIYLEVPSDSIDWTIALAGGIDPHVSIRTGTALADFYGAYPSV